VPGSLNNHAVNDASVSKEELYIASVKDRAHERLVTEVGNYIYSMAPESGLNPEMVVSVCEKYDLNIIFVLAQGLLESHFGTKGVAARTNSVWNVGTYDNGVIMYSYKDPNESIEPYAKLVYDDYLLRTDPAKTGKTITHLLQDRGFVNYAGNRYASAKGYENALRKLMVKIDMQTSINMLQSIRTLPDEDVLTFFGPIESRTAEEHSFYAQN